MDKKGFREIGQQIPAYLQSVQIVICGSEFRLRLSPSTWIMGKKGFRESGQQIPAYLQSVQIVICGAVIFPE
ncbi:MAG: hypothetical protein DRI57_17545 [Deltaproteobacteria bacterium]|nr:MAG: hypothetical protein DRI57_17545 [Deltaproteobacteria bacterium]